MTPDEAHRARRKCCGARHRFTRTRLATIRESLLALAQSDWEELIRIWRNPGWATPAEFFLVETLLESIAAQTAQLVRPKDQLTEGSAMVGAG